MRIMVPATTANLGPGFDALGLALDLYNTYDFEPLEDGRVKIVSNPPYDNERNMVYVCFQKALEALNKRVNGVKITIDTKIPICRGLGSSASCIVGGILGAFCMTNTPIDADKVLEIATSIEGHPDNVAPALLGGFVASVMTANGHIYTTQVQIKNDYDFICVVPNFKLSTKEARAALPRRVNFKDAVYNASRVALLIGSLQNGEDGNLREALNDRLHQHYRKHLIRGYDKVMKFLDSKTLGTCLSGAGPTMLAIAQPNQKHLKEEVEAFLNRNHLRWEVKLLKINRKGAVIEWDTNESIR